MRRTKTTLRIRLTRSGTINIQSAVRKLTWTLTETQTQTQQGQGHGLQHPHGQGHRHGQGHKHRHGHGHGFCELFGSTHTA
jgi:hypothetical protein